MDRYFLCQDEEEIILTIFLCALFPNNLFRFQKEPVFKSTIWQYDFDFGRTWIKIS
jgi:hypothetical protein